MKKRKLILTLVSLFSLFAIFACEGNVETNNNSDFDDFEQAGQTPPPLFETVQLKAYEEENYKFDSSVTNANGSVCYEIFVRSFYDTNNDGIGDFNGVTAKLPYLKDLGVKTLWLMPIMPSPSYHGYDVADYYDVNPDYGTMSDFDNLLAEAKKYNIDIMIDIVFNHSSTQNPWFKQSYEDYVSNNTSLDSKADWYCWIDHYQTGYSIYSGSKGIYYESRFDHSMPDLNTQNEAVRAEMLKILKYWVEKGVDGFRFDAVKYFDFNNTKYNVEFMTYLHDEIVKDYPGIYFVGECWDGITVINDYYKSTFESFFTFGSSLDGNGDASIVGQVKTLTSANSFASTIENRERIMKENNPNAYSSYFLSNHDMDRASNSLTNENAKLAASLYLLLPGTPYMYYGEEIELMGKRKTAPEDASDARRRLPMIWSMTDKEGECGFPEPHRVDLMTNEQVKLGVAEQMDKNYSLWNHYKKVIEIRNKYPFIKNSVFTNMTKQIDTKLDNILAYELSYGDESIIVIHNFENANASVDLSKIGVSSILDEVSVSRQYPELSNNILKIGKWSTVILSKK
jgi:alpha-amylase